MLYSDYRVAFVMTIRALSWLVVAVAGVAALQYLGRAFGPEARDRRRRRRNYGPVHSRRHRPTVQLVVKVLRA